MLDITNNDQEFVSEDEKILADMDKEAELSTNAQTQHRSHKPNTFRMDYGSMTHPISGVQYGVSLGDRTYQMWALEVLWTMFREEFGKS